MTIYYMCNNNNNEYMYAVYIYIKNHVLYF